MGCHFYKHPSKSHSYLFSSFALARRSSLVPSWGIWLWSCDCAGPGAAVCGATLDLIASITLPPLSLLSSMGWEFCQSSVHQRVEWWN